MKSMLYGKREVNRKPATILHHLYSRAVAPLRQSQLPLKPVVNLL